MSVAVSPSGQVGQATFASPVDASFKPSADPTTTGAAAAASPNLASPTVMTRSISESSDASGTAGPSSPLGSPDGAAPAAGWIPAFEQHGELKSPGADGSTVSVAVQEEIPQAVSEERQEQLKQAEYDKAQTGWFKQSLAKVKSNLFGPLHVGDALFTAWVLLWIIVTGTETKSVKWFWLILFFLFYGWYLHWNWKCDERMFFWNMLDVAAFESYWKNLRTQNPIIQMRTESWHWERRVSHHTTYNNNGGSTTTTTVTYVRVVSHTETETFQYRLCADLSLDVEGSDLTKHPATFVSLWKEYIFGDVQTALAYHLQYAALRQRNQNRDANMDSYEWMDIPTWMHRVGVYRDAASRPILLRGWIYIACCVCLLSWPIKIYGEFVAKKGGFYMKKQVHV